MRRVDLDELGASAEYDSRQRDPSEVLSDHGAPSTRSLLEQLADRAALPVDHAPIIFDALPVSPRDDAWLKEFEAQFEEGVPSMEPAAASAQLREQAKPAQAVKSAMIALYPSPGQATRLTIADGEPAGKLHVTLAFLGRRPWDEHTILHVSNAVRSWASGIGHLGGIISGAGVFTEGEDAPVTYLSVDLPSLPGLRDGLVSRLDRIGVPPSREHSYTPHMTLLYGSPPTDYAPPRNEKIVFSSVSLVIGDERRDFPLSGTEAMAEACRMIEAALADHAQRELDKADMFNPDSLYGGMLGRAVLKLVKAMEGEGHSGMSAQMALDLFDRLARFKPLTPLTDDPAEWHDVSDMSFTGDQLAEGQRMWQNVRDPSAFSEDGGRHYYLLEDRTEHVTEDGLGLERTLPRHCWPALREAALSGKARTRLPKAAFAIPEKAPTSGSYPIHDRSHARNALSRCSGKPEEARVRAAVKRRYPGLIAEALRESPQSSPRRGSARTTAPRTPKDSQRGPGSQPRDPPDAKTGVPDRPSASTAETRPIAARAQRSVRPEDDPAFNWRRDGGRRGVTLRDGSRRIVNPETFDRLRRTNVLDDTRTPRLRGDVDEPDLEFVDGHYDERTQKFHPPYVYSAGERLPVGTRVTGIVGGRGGGGRVVGTLGVEHNGAITVAGRRVKRLAPVGEHLTTEQRRAQATADQPTAADNASDDEGTKE